MTPRTLRNWIWISLPAMLVWLVFVKWCCATAPSFDIHLVPTTAASGRMDPCPVFAYVTLGRQNAKLSGIADDSGTTWTAEANNEYSLDQTLGSISPSGSGTPRNISVRTGVSFNGGGAGSDTWFAEGTAGSLSQGEWAISGGTLYVRMPDDSDPDADTSDYALFASWDIADPGDGKELSYSTIQWQITLDGGATWPSQYRYIVDQRPQLNSKQIDLSGTTDTGNGNRPNGLSMGWVLPAGTHTISCTWTNSLGESTTETQGVTIAADTRTETTVNSAGGADYASLDEAIIAIEAAGFDDQLITVEGGHDEDIDTGEWTTTITLDNVVVAWDGNGARPVLNYIGTNTGGGGVVFGTSGDNTVFYGIDFVDATEDIVNGTYEAVVNARLGASSGTNTAFVSITADSINRGFNDNADGMLIQSCTVGETVASYTIKSDGNFDGQFCGIYLGNDFGPSVYESSTRFSSFEQALNFCWNRVEETLHTGVTTGTVQPSLKSTMRLANGGYYNVYGNYLINGDAFAGRVNPGEAIGTSCVRVDANYHGVREQMIVLDDALGVVWINGINEDATATQDKFINGGDGYSRRCLMAHNTGIQVREYVGYGGADDNGLNEDNVIAANLSKMNTGNPRGRFIQVAETDTYRNNVYDDDSSATTEFGRSFVNGSANTSFANTAALNALAWASGNQKVSFTFNSEYVPSADVSVTTEPGVHFDYYGHARDSTSYAGAVQSFGADGPPAETFQTFIPGVLIRQP